MIETGTILGGYRIDGLIGQGGMGVVYEATQLSLSRTVALKVLSPTISSDPAFRERFRREGLLQAAIDHPHIIPVHEAGESDEGLFLAMRLVRGPNLRELIMAEQLGPQRALALLEQVAGALDAAHEAGMIHRDIKPQNILVGPRDHAYLADFGLTKAIGDQGLTQTGQFVGTIDYVSPEQIRGEPPTALSDIYSLGAVVYEAFTGQVPFPKDSDAAVLYAHVSEPPPMLTAERPDLPVALDAVVRRALAKEPRARYASAVELLADAKKALEPGRPVGRSTVVAKKPPRARPRRRPIRRLGVATAAAGRRAAGGVRRGTGRIAAGTRTTVRMTRTGVTRLATTVLAGITGAGHAAAATGGKSRRVLGKAARSRVVWICVGAVLIAVAAGAGYSIAPKRHRTEATPATTFRFRELTLDHPTSWVGVDPPAGLSVPASAALALTDDPGVLLTAGVEQAQPPGFVPASLRGSLGSAASRPQAVALGGRVALRFEGSGAAPLVYVVPLPGGRALTLACVAPQDVVPACAEVLATASWSGPTLDPRRDAEYLRDLSGTLAGLTGTARTLRTALRSRKTSSGQASIAERLATLYRGKRAAVDAIHAPTELAGANARVAQRLGNVAGAYTELAAAARQERRLAYRSAALKVRRAEVALSAQLDRLGGRS